jgi:hypothetical protein
MNDSFAKVFATPPRLHNAEGRKGEFASQCATTRFFLKV